MPATEKDATSRLGVLDCIVDQIAQDGAEQQAIAHDRSPTGNHVNAYALGQRILLTLPAGLPQNLIDAYRLKLETLSTFSDAQRSQDLLELLL